MAEKPHGKDIDHHLNNLVFSLYNFAKAKKKAAEKNKVEGKPAGDELIPLEMLMMLKRKIGGNLTVDEGKLIASLITDLQGGPYAADEKIQQLSMYEQQVELVQNPEARPYKFSSIVESAFSTVKIQRTMIQIMLGDLTMHPVEAIVSPDTTDLWMEQGVASVIRLKGGDSIRVAARKAGSVGIGTVYVTEAGDLIQKCIFHTAIMLPEQETKAEYIHRALENIFSTAEDMKIKSIAIPALGVATTKFSYEVLARVMIQHIFNHFLSQIQTSINLIVISLFNKEAYTHFIKQFRAIAEMNKLDIEDYS